MGYLMGPVMYEGGVNRPQPAAPAQRDEDTRALREAWGRNSAARARAGLAPYTDSEVENLLRTRQGANPTPQMLAMARDSLTAWLDAETASLAQRSGVKASTSAAPEGGGFPVLPVLGLGLLALFFLKGK